MSKPTAAQLKVLRLLRDGRPLRYSEIAGPWTWDNGIKNINTNTFWALVRTGMLRKDPGTMHGHQFYVLTDAGRKAAEESK